MMTAAVVTGAVSAYDANVDDSPAAAKAMWDETGQTGDWEYSKGKGYSPDSQNPVYQRTGHFEGSSYYEPTKANDPDNGKLTTSPTERWMTNELQLPGVLDMSQSEGLPLNSTAKNMQIGLLLTFTVLALVGGCSQKSYITIATDFGKFEVFSAFKETGKNDVRRSFEFRDPNERYRIVLDVLLETPARILEEGDSWSSPLVKSFFTNSRRPTTGAIREFLDQPASPLLFAPDNQTWFAGLQKVKRNDLIVGESILWGSLDSPNKIFDPIVLEQRTLTAKGMLSISAYLFSGKTGSVLSTLTKYGTVQGDTLAIAGQEALEKIADDLESGNIPEPSPLGQLKATLDQVVASYVSKD